jgi:2-methylaconitate cis-trans-isomerase PrpF
MALLQLRQSYWPEVTAEAFPISCAVVRCGTSRAVIVNGPELPGHEREREEALLNLIMGRGIADGLGGEHYQLNKVAAVYPSHLPDHFCFQFYQVDRAKGSLMADLECANVAAGAAMFAMLRGIATPNAWGGLVGVNLGTRQHVELRPLGSPAMAMSGPWMVRFPHDGQSVRESFSGEEPLTLAHPDGRTVDYWVVERGNVFVLTQTAPEDMEPELVEALAQQGSELASMIGADPSRARAPKVLAYSVESRELTQARIRAACFFNGERHASLPGSGAMCLASCLAVTHLEEVRPEGSEGVLLFQLIHPSGEMQVAVHWERTPQGYRVATTEFATPVRLLLVGNAMLPLMRTQGTGP